MISNIVDIWRIDELSVNNFWIIISIMYVCLILIKCLKKEKIDLIFWLCFLV